MNNLKYYTATILLSMIISSSLQAGLVDSVLVYQEKDQQYLYIEGEFAHRGIHITRINDSLTPSNDLVANVYLEECLGGQMITPYDTTLLLADSLPSIDDLTLNYYRDTNTVPPCYFNDSIYLINTFNYSFVGINDKHIRGNLKIFPNPASDYVQIILSGKVKNSIKRVELLDMKGRLIRCYEHEFSRINVKNIASGFFLIRVYTSQGNITRLLSIRPAN